MQKYGICGSIIGAILWVSINAAWAVDFTREEIAIMHRHEVRMALPDERQPYVVPVEIAPALLVYTELLDFSNRPLYEAPAWLARFKNLRKLDLSNTRLSAQGLVAILSELHELEVLNLSNNPLFAEDASLAELWAHLPRLSELNLSQTGLQPAHLGALTALNLVRLNLADNPDLGALDDLGIGQLNRLRELNLSNTGLASISPQHLPAASLIRLDLSHNTLKDIPFMDFAALEQLNILGNQRVTLAERYASILSVPRLVQLLAHDDAVIPDGLITKLNMQVYSMEDFTDAGHGTVIDTRTNLQWMRCAIGQSWNGFSCAGEAERVPWAATANVVRTVNRQSQEGDWRLPTVTELKSIVYCNNTPDNPPQRGMHCASFGLYAGGPSINPLAFPNAPASYFWSQTALKDDYSWGIDFNSGRDHWDLQAIPAYIRLVRNR